MNWYRLPHTDSEAYWESDWVCPACGIFKPQTVATAIGPRGRRNSYIYRMTNVRLKITVTKELRAKNVAYTWFIAPAGSSMFYICCQCFTMSDFERIPVSISIEELV